MRENQPVGDGELCRFPALLYMSKYNKAASNFKGLQPLFSAEVDNILSVTVPAVAVEFH